MTKEEFKENLIDAGFHLARPDELRSRGYVSSTWRGKNKIDIFFYDYSDNAYLAISDNDGVIFICLYKDIDDAVSMPEVEIHFSSYEEALRYLDE